MITFEWVADLMMKPLQYFPSFAFQGVSAFETAGTDVRHLDVSDVGTRSEEYGLYF